MMKLSCPDFAFPLLTYPQLTRLIASLGFRYADVGLMEGRTHHQPSGELDNPSRSALVLRGELALHGLSASDLFYQAGNDFRAVAVNHPDPAVRRRLRETFRRVAEYAAALGSRHVTILPGADFGADSLRLAAEELNARVRIARELGLTLGVEAHLGSLIPLPEQARELCDAVPGLTLTLDLSHFERQGVSHERMLPLCPYASHVHARGANRLELQCPVRTNTIDFPALVRGLHACGYTGFADLEYTYSEWENSDRTDNLSEIIQMRSLLEKTGCFER